MNLVLPIVYGAAGAALGLGLPHFADVIAGYKVNRKGTGTAAVGWVPPGWLRWPLSLVNAAVWLLAGAGIKRPAEALFLSVLFSLSVLIALIDLSIRIIPNELVLTMLAAGALYQMVRSGFPGLLLSVLCMIVMMLLFAVVAAFIGFGKVGAGDVKLAGAMGFALAYPDIVTALIFMSAALFVYVAAGMALRKVTLRTMVPFAPFLMFGMAGTLVLKIFSL